MIRKTAVDTSLAVPLVLANHVLHDEVARWAEGRELWLAGHAAVETLSVLTRLPGDMRTTSATAVVLIEDRFAGILALPEGAASNAHRAIGEAGVAGGAVYDALVGLAARYHGARLVTRDRRALGAYAAVSADAEVMGAS
ncbi:MAG: PIN domain-containing protein [Propionibacteriaceae bacterium]|nr:PIN domain-containing protein [Propionibacteriaceae bacterium]